MLEVFTIIFFVAWFHDRKVALTIIKTSSSWFNSLFFYQHFHLFFPRNKDIEINKQTPRCIFYSDVFCAAGNTLKKGCDQLAIIT
jgi:hypothetical protein